MKYGRLSFANTPVDNKMCNLGDVIQSIAVDKLYEKMGVSREDCIDIRWEDMQTYQGETVLLPLDAFFLQVK